jgi:hypothetical protein
LTLCPISADGWNDGDRRKRRGKKKKKEKGTSEADGFLARLIEPDDQNDLMDDTKIIVAFPDRGSLLPEGRIYRLDRIGQSVGMAASR